MSELSIPDIVGILNITPDSFSDGGLYFDPEAALEHAHQMIADGASLIDVGAESTNPFSTALAIQEEQRRLQPVLQALCPEFPGLISVDTYHAQTARWALKLGAAIINDVTMFRDPAMVDVAADYAGKAQFIVSHLSPAVANIAEAHALNPTKSVEEVKRELLAKRQELIERGIPAQDIILDPGIGFGKDPANNHALNRQLLKFADEVPGIPVMIGYSRKRFLGEDRKEIEPNLRALEVVRATSARYIRVHDVAAHEVALAA